mmetsp:Transcript_51909/g.82814  ORF Transcript_51909/g.82814 Transcript_51909/m.82814 type:complete len:310 (+) Transcript_51909:27-956(+)
MALKLSSIFRGRHTSVLQPSFHRSLFPSLSSASTSAYRLSTQQFTTTTSTSYQHILTETRENNIGLITLNRPKALNALCNDLLNEIVTALLEFDKDDNVSAIIITGSGEKAFCAGADIKEMEPKTYMDVYKEDMFTIADTIYSKVRKPIIAAVNGFALGGGCELAMTCDIILAEEKAKFGQPEITLGTIPGIGGTQRLTRAVGKSKAMELCLTGDMFTAQQAMEWGLISNVVPNNTVLDEAIKLANKITSKSQPIVAITKECVNRAYESSLKEGLLFERRLFHSTFSTKDQKEGMSAFREKRKPKFTHE